MLVRRLAFVVVLACVVDVLAVRPSQAQAQAAPDAAPAVAIIRIDIFGDNPPGLVDELDGRLVNAIEQAGFAATTQAQAAELLAAKPTLANCISSDCLRELPAVLGTNQFLHLRIESSGSIYDFELLLLTATADGGGITDQKQDSCPVCTTDEFLDQVTTVANALMQAHKPIAVEIASDPPGAMLIVDGRELGVSPYTGKLAPGPHQVEATLDGYTAAAQQVTVAADASGAQRFTVTLEKSGGGVVDNIIGGGGGGSLIKWPVAAAAVGTVAWGITWVMIDGDLTCSGGAPSECPDKYDTGTYGYVLIGAGVALGAAAGYLFWRDGQGGADGVERVALPALVPLRGGGAAGVWQLRF